MDASDSLDVATDVAAVQPFRPTLCTDEARLQVDRRGVCQDTRERYVAWCQRRLDAHVVVYCYLKLRPDDEPAGVLVAGASP